MLVLEHLVTSADTPHMFEVQEFIPAWQDRLQVRTLQSVESHLSVVWCIGKALIFFNKYPTAALASHRAIILIFTYSSTSLTVDLEAVDLHADQADVPAGEPGYPRRRAGRHVQCDGSEIRLRVRVREYGLCFRWLFLFMV